MTKEDYFYSLIKKLRWYFTASKINEIISETTNSFTSLYKQGEAEEEIIQKFDSVHKSCNVLLKNHKFNLIAGYTRIVSTVFLIFLPLICVLLPSIQLPYPFFFVYSFLAPVILIVLTGEYKRVDIKITNKKSCHMFSYCFFCIIVLLCFVAVIMLVQFSIKISDLNINSLFIFRLPVILAFITIIFWLYRIFYPLFNYMFSCYEHFLYASFLSVMANCHDFIRNYDFSLLLPTRNEFLIDLSIKCLLSMFVGGAGCLCWFLYNYNRKKAIK